MIITAKQAGFCFGVDRAIDMVYERLNQGEKVCTLGEIIHNPQMVQELASRGVLVVDSPSQVPKGYSMVIRSHGVGTDIYAQLAELGISYVDATCPFVAKIHSIVANTDKEEDIVLIAGDAKHPEVQGIIGHCSAPWLSYMTVEELEKLPLSHPELSKKRIVMVAQTTFNTLMWLQCVKTAKKVYTKLAIFDTICNATVNRQKESQEISKQVDMMIVIGGRHSSNTAKLKEVCEENCTTILVETAKELKPDMFCSACRIGITAGASTPARIIKEVQQTMSEILNNVENEDINFEEALEETLKSTYTGEKVTGIVSSVSPNEVSVDIGTKHAGYIPASELSDDPNAKPEDIVKPGDEISLIVLRVNDQEGTVMLSKKRVDAMEGFEKICEAQENETTMQGTVIDVVKGGVIAVTGGARVFIPASQATASRNEPLEDLLKKDVEFKILEVNRGRKRAVGSIRAVLKEKRKAQEDAFWADVEIGKKYTGTVKSLTSYGAFVDLGGVDGMIHVSELSWSRIKHPSEIVNVGDVVDVYVKDLDTENRKISLGFKKAEDNPWEILRRDFPEGTVCDAKIVSLTTFGAFAQIIPGVDGLIHISQIANERIEKPQDVLSVGQEVKVKITAIDFDKKRVSLSMKALLEDAHLAKASEADEVVASTEE